MKYLKHNFLFALIQLLILNPQAYCQNWERLGDGMDWAVRTLYADTISQVLYAGGNFRTADNKVVNGIAQWNGVSWDSLGPGLITCCNPVVDIERFDGHIYAAGFGGYGIAKWDGSSWEDVNGSANFPVFGLRAYTDNLYAVGWFDTIGGIPASKVARWDGISWHAIDTTKWLGSAIGCVIRYHDDLYIGGNIVNRTGTINGIARWDGVRWLPVGNGIVGPVLSFEIYDDKLIVGGRFNTDQGNPGNAIASWDGTKWENIGGGMTSRNASILSMKVFSNDLYAVGGFLNAGGVSMIGIAKWDGTNWCSLGFDSPDSNGLFSLEVLQNEIYVGGAFQMIVGDSMNSVAKWIGGNYVEQCGNITAAEDILNPEGEVVLFPNPSIDHFTLSIPVASGPTEISIHDATGREVMAASKYTSGEVDVSGLSAGLYFVRVKANSWTQTVKLLKE